MTSGMFIPSGTSTSVRTTATRWLLWDGRYTFQGDCNRVLPELDPGGAFNDDGLQRRLARLGYDCSHADPDVSAQRTWIALNAVLSYTGKPEGWANMRGNAGHTDLFTRFQVANPRQAIRQLLRDRGAELQKLDAKLTSKWNSLGLAREWGAMQLAIEEAPESIPSPHDAVMGFKTRMAGHKAARSMMIRIFRNQDDSAISRFRGLVYQEILDGPAIAALPKGKPKEGALLHYKPGASTARYNRYGRDLTVASEVHAPYCVEVTMSRAVDAFEGFRKNQPGPGEDDLTQPMGALGMEQAILEDSLGGGEGAAYTTFGVGCEQLGNRDQPHTPADVLQNQIGLFDNQFVLRLTDHAKEVYDDLRIRSDHQKRAECSRPDGVLCPTFGDCQRIKDDATDVACRNWSCEELKETLDAIAKHADELAQSFCCGHNRYLDDDAATGLDRADVVRIMGEVKDRIQDLRNDGDQDLTTAPDAQGAPVLAADAKTAFTGYRYADTIRFIVKWVDMIDFIVWRTRVRREEALFHTMYPEDAPANIDNDDLAMNWGRNNREAWRTEPGPILQAGHPRYADNVTLGGIWANGYPRTAQDTHHIDRVLPKPEAITIPSYNALDYAFFLTTRPVPIYVVALLNIKNIVADRVYMSPHNFFNHDLFHIVGTEQGKNQLWDTLRDNLQKEKHVPELRTAGPVGPPMDLVLTYWQECADTLANLLAPLQNQVTGLENAANTAKTAYQNDQDNDDRRQAAVDTRTAYRSRKKRLKAIESLLFALVHEPISHTVIFRPNLNMKAEQAQMRHNRFPAVPEAALLRKRLDMRRRDAAAPNNAALAEDNGFVRYIWERYKTGFFGEFEPYGFVMPEMVDELGQAADCAACRTAIQTNTDGCHDGLDNLTNSQYWANGTGCAMGWVLRSLQELPDYGARRDAWAEADRRAANEELPFPDGVD